MALVEAHGHGVWCYDHLENIAQDPNLTIECLQRTFKKVEANLGRLPDHLFIQMDNCWRENKNNALVHWLVIHTDLATPVTPKPHTTSLSTPQVSLVDRGLFPGGIEMCFLPKGHTHNEMDQHASRISVGVRKRDVFNRDQLVERVQSAFRGLETERISLVANTKQWLNKGTTEATRRSWTKSEFRRMHNISSRRFFRIAKETVTNRISIRFKEKATDYEWSEPWFPLKNPDKPLSLDANRGLNAVKELEPTRKKLVQKHVTNCLARVPREFLEGLQSDLTLLLTQKPAPFHWVDGGVFKQESEEAPFHYDVPDPDRIEFQRPPGVYNNPLRPGFDPNGPGCLIAGNYIAVLARGWVKSPPTKVGFRVGKITDVFAVEQRVKVAWFSTTQATVARAKWRPFVGVANNFVPLSDILMTFTTSAFTPVWMRLTAPTQRCIAYKIRVSEGTIEENEQREKEVLEGLAFDAKSIDEYLEDAGVSVSANAKVVEEIPGQRLREFTAVLMSKLAASANNRKLLSEEAEAKDRLCSSSSSSSLSLSANRDFDIGSDSEFRDDDEGHFSPDDSDTDRDDNEYQCSICGQCLLNQSGLTRHMNARHEGLAERKQKPREPAAPIGTGVAMVQATNILSGSRRSGSRRSQPHVDTSAQEEPVGDVVEQARPIVAAELAPPVGQSKIDLNNIVYGSRTRGTENSVKQ